MGRGVSGRARRQNEGTRVNPQAMGLADHQYTQYLFDDCQGYLLHWCHEV